MTSKSRTTSAVLTILFGPLGLFYTTVWGAIALTVLAFVSAPTLIGPLFAWAVSIFWGDNLVKKHNAALNVRPAQAETSPAPAPAPVPEPAQEKPGISLIPGTGEMIAYAGVAVFMVFVLPPLLGKPEGMSALVFYMNLLGL
jgi:hypothetical protein